MSQTTTPRSFIGTALAGLDAQQRTIPENERGLAKELADLQKRLAENPALENDPRFCTQVAWLVQDWQKFSGTGQAPAVSPFLTAGMAQLASTCPGLENPQIRAALEQTAALHDHALITDIRSVAMETARLTPGQQDSFMARMAAEHLVQRVQMSLGTPVTAREAAPPPVQPDIAPEPMAEQSVRSQPAPEPVAEPEPPAADPFPSEAGDPGFAPAFESEEPAQAGKPEASQEESEPAHSGEPLSNDTKTEMGRDNDHELGTAEVPEQMHDDAAAHAAEHKVQQKAANTERPTDQEREDRARMQDQRAAHEAEQQQPSREARPQRVNVPNNTQAPDSPDQAKTKPSATPQNTQQTAPAATPSPFAAIGEWGRNFKGKRDESRINKMIADTTTAMDTVRDRLGVLRREETGFFERIETAARTSGETVPAVIAGMTADGPFGELRQEYDTICQRNPNFVAARNELHKAGIELRTATRRLDEESRERGASEQAPVMETTRNVAALGLELEKVPGEQAGRNFLQDIGGLVERLVEKFRAHFERIFGQQRERDSSPSMER
ncbi:hypothetical protein [Komagataeibacter saccharivorans]|uniref:hypothetical protein n=1 Tax=Komagataeibacter saccharivorans TaxID=265959 RepID=UPI001044BD37|nr:hypothetical protein [Komagataeibacter saccharivorans]QBL95449.1 hypothetical protein KSAC_32700 [Komagataeibacter saccharivorans]